MDEQRSGAAQPRRVPPRAGEQPRRTPAAARRGEASPRTQHVASSPGASRTPAAPRSATDGRAQRAPGATARAPRSAAPQARRPQERAGTPARVRVPTSARAGQRPSAHRAAAGRRPMPPTPRGPLFPRARVGDPRRRQRWFMACVLAVLVGFTGRLVSIQIIQGPELAAAALEQRLVSGTIPAGRGDIFDAEGNVLATSGERYHIKADLTLVPTWKHVVDREIVGTGIEAAAEVLAPLLGVQPAELAATLVGTARGKYIAKNVLPDTWQAIKAFNITGIAAERTSVREYPNGTTAGNIIGFVNSEGVGSAGVEQTFDEALRGTPGSYEVETGLRGHQIPTGEQERTEAQPGQDVRLTLSGDLQWKAQDAIQDAKRKTGATYGFAIVQDVKTGAVLALGETDTVNPGDLSSSDPSTWGSRAVSNVFEPGSTAKVITMAAALETGVVTPTSKFEVPDAYVTSNNQTIRDSHEHPVQKMTVAGIFAESSNTGTVQIGEKLPKQVRYDFLSKFGFGQRTGVGLPGESPGILHPVDKWDGRTQWNVLFGQGVSVNAIQANEVFATIANGGLRAQPHIVKEYVGPDGAVTPYEVGDPVRVVSEKTADTVLAMMESVVSEGTGSLAAIPGYRVAGKTGTAQAANPDTGKLDHFVASFNGVAPADDPRVAVSVVLYYPELQYGGVVAAPVFSDVTAFALQHLGVEPNDSKPKTFPLEW